jgi:hypothetical protein
MNKLTEGSDGGRTLDTAAAERTVETLLKGGSDPGHLQEAGRCVVVRRHRQGEEHVSKEPGLLPWREEAHDETTNSTIHSAAARSSARFRWSMPRTATWWRACRPIFWRVALPAREGHSLRRRRNLEGHCPAEIRNKKHQDSLWAGLQDVAQKRNGRSITRSVFDRWRDDSHPA